MSGQPDPIKHSIQDIGSNIRKWRRIKEMKQSHLAIKLGISIGTLSQLENGKINITYSRIRQLSEALQISELQLLFVDPYSVIFKR